VAQAAPALREVFEAFAFSLVLDAGILAGTLNPGIPLGVELPPAFFQIGEFFHPEIFERTAKVGERGLAVPGLEEQPIGALGIEHAQVKGDNGGRVDVEPELSRVVHHGSHLPRDYGKGETTIGVAVSLVRVPVHGPTVISAPSSTHGVAAPRDATERRERARECAVLNLAARRKGAHE
jgi:hypothetical protein